jgi:ParB-like chromosome segregation protein Spo0J
MKTFRQILSEVKILKMHPKKLVIDVFDDAIVRKYVRRLEKGEKLTPSFVNQLDKSRLVDGNHRAAAYRELGKRVPVVLVDRLDMLQKMGKGMSAEDYYKQL